MQTVIRTQHRSHRGLLFSALVIGLALGGLVAVAARLRARREDGEPA